MRIAHVIESLDPANGGPPVIAIGLAAAQARAGASVRIIAQRPTSGDRATAALLEGVPDVDDVRLERFMRRGVAGWLARGARTLGPVLDDVNVIHLHGVWEPILVAAIAAARRARMPYLYHLHGYLHPWSLAQKALPKRVLLSVFHRRRLNGAAGLIVGNDIEGTAAAQLGLRAPRFTVPNGVFLEHVPDARSLGRFRSRIAGLGDAPFILFLGRLHHMKGLDRLAAAFERVAASDGDVRLVVIGPDGGDRAPFERRILAAGLGDRVHVLEPIYGPAKYEALLDARCFCLPSRREGHSMAILEALACGTPVVLSEGCHFPVAETAGAGRVVPADPAALASALLEIVTDDDVHAATSASARRLVEARYTWQHAAACALEAYRSVCS